MTSQSSHFRQSFDDRPYFGEPLLVPFYTSLNADISGARKDIHNLQYFQSEMKTKNLKLSLLKVRHQYTIWDVRFYSLQLSQYKISKIMLIYSISDKASAKHCNFFIGQRQSDQKKS